jgi:hypothetical protein
MCVRIKLAPCPSLTPVNYENCYTNDCPESLELGQKVELPS